MNTTIKHISALLIIVAACCGCDSNVFPSWPKESSHVIDTVDCSQWNIPAGSMTVQKALNIGRQLGSGGVSEETYYIKGVVTGFDNSLDKYNKKKHESGMLEYGNGVFYIKDNALSTAQFYCYQVMGIDGDKFTSLSQLQIGDFVVVKGKISNYNGTIETESKGAACLAFSTNKSAYPQEGDTIDTSKFPNFPQGTITVAKARKIGKELGSGGTTTEEYMIKGRVKSFGSKHNEETIKSYGNAYVYIHDSESATTDFYGYQVMGLNGAKLTSLDQIKVGDFIVIKGKITNYNGTIETEGKGVAQIVYSTNDLMYPVVEKKYIEESFTGGTLGNWVEQVMSGSVKSVWGAYSTSGVTGAVATSGQASESWLVSPEINVGATHTAPVRLTFSHYYKAPTASRTHVKDYLRVKVRNNSGTWNDIEIQNFNTGSRATYKADTLDITPYADGNIKVAFAYKYDSVFQPESWNVTNITVVENKRADR